MKSGFGIAVAATSLLAACGGGGGAGGGGFTLFPNAIVSVASNGDQANSWSQYAALSADGRYVAFRSAATNLDPHCTNGNIHVYVRDRETGSTVCVSVNSNGEQGNLNSNSSLINVSAAISADGRYVAYESASTNLVGSDINGDLDVFVHDRDADNDGIFDEPGAIRTVLISQVFGSQLPGPSENPSISADGRYVAFTSVISKAADNTAIESDIFVHDRDFDGNGIYDEPGAGNTRTVRVSVSDSGVPGNALSGSPKVSADGRIVAFRSTSTNLIDGLDGLDQPGTEDIFVHDRDADGNGVFDEAGGISTTLVTHLFAEPIIPVGQADTPPCLSANGRYVGFTSTFDFVGGDVNGVRDVFVYDRQDGTNTLVSVNSAGGQTDGPSYWCSLSADGRYVAFSSNATNLVAGDTNGAEDVFVHDRQTGRTTRVTDNSTPIFVGSIYGFSAPALSADGRYIGFQSFSDDLVAGDTNGTTDVFEFQRP